MKTVLTVADANGNWTYTGSSGGWRIHLSPGAVLKIQQATRGLKNAGVTAA
ncbi:hypothetical protein KIF59_23125 [Enterobacter cloacae subsp. cloacae]|nr:hypothetical protein [Enterobacter cloacae subsp. cloacae]